jgi:two-component system cell cycle response regulator DivK
MKPTILLIEDNEQNLYLATFLLEQNGFTVVQARSGPEGIELAGRIQPALIILDIQLPQMDGYAVAQELRQNLALKDVPIVAVTSYAMVGDRERALEAGCSGYIEKPINPDTFRTQIEMYLKARPVGGETQP